MSAPGDGAFSRVGQGIRWSATGAVVLRLAQFSMGIVAARLVAPEQFGAFAVALTVYGIVLTMSDMGVTQAIPREVTRTPEIGPTVMTLNMGATVVVAGLMAWTAEPVAAMFGAVDAAPAIRILALTMCVGALGTVPAAVLARDYRQKERFWSDAVNLIVSSALLVVLALQGYGALALAWSRFGGQAASAIVLNVVCKERYRFGFDKGEAVPLLRFSLPLAAAMGVDVGINNVDTLAVGRFAGAEALGYYNLAFTVAAWPIGILSQIMMNITMTTLARSQDDLPTLRFHLRSLSTALSGVAFPAAAMIMALAAPLVTVVYGERWLPAALPLMTLGAFTVVKLVQVMLTDLFTALGLTRDLLWVQVVWLVALAPAMFWMVSTYGYEGAAIAHIAVGILIVIPMYLIVAHRRTGVGIGWVRPELLKPLFASVIAGLGASFTTTLLDHPLAQLLVGGLVGGALYLLLVGRWLFGHLSRMRTVYSGSKA